MTRQRLTILVAGAVLVALSALWVLRGRTIVLPVIEPPAPVPVALTGPEAESRLVLPVSVPLAELTRLVNTAEDSMRGTKSDPVAHKALVDDRLDWVITRGAISLRLRKDRLVFATPLAGRARLTGRTDLVRGKLGQLLGRAGGDGMPVDLRVDLAADLSVSAQPRLREDWAILPDLRARAQLTEAQLPVGGIGRLSLRGLLQPQLDKAVQGALDKASARLSDPSVLRDVVAPVWADLCRVRPLGDDGIWLVTTPSRISAAQPRIIEDALHLAVGLSLRSHAVSGTTAPAPGDCKALPLSLEIGDLPESGALDLRLPLMLGWDWLGPMLDESAARRAAKHPGGVRFSNFRAQGDGARLLIGADLDLPAKGLFSPRVTGRIWLSGRARHDPEKGVLRIDDIALAPASREALGTLRGRIAAAVVGGWAAEGAALDLRRLEARALDRARAQLDRLTSDLKGSADFQAGLDAVRIEKLAVTPLGLEAMVTATGQIRARNLVLK